MSDYIIGLKKAKKVGLSFKKASEDLICSNENDIQEMKIIFDNKELNFQFAKYMKEQKRLKNQSMTVSADIEDYINIDVIDGIIKKEISCERKKVNGKIKSVFYISNQFRELAENL